MNFISRRDSTLDLLVSCLTYLCYDALADDLDEDRLRDNIIAGKYRFLAFASSSWFDLARQYVRLAPEERYVSALNGLMEQMYSELWNPSFQGDLNDDDGAGEKPLQLGHPPWPNAPEFISQTVRFRFYRDHPKEPWTLENGKSLQRNRLSQPNFKPTRGTNRRGKHWLTRLRR